MRVVCSPSGEHGALLSNTWITYPWDRDNPGKLGIIPDRPWRLEGAMVQRGNRPPKDGSAAYQVVVGVTHLLAYDGYGLWEQEPGDGF